MSFVLDLGLGGIILPHTHLFHMGVQEKEESQPSSPNLPRRNPLSLFFHLFYLVVINLSFNPLLLKTWSVSVSMYQYCLGAC